MDETTAGAANEVASKKDMTYRARENRDLHADIYVPQNGSDACPAVVLVHGGGWNNDHRGMYESHLRRFAARGYVGADITHRLSGEAAFPACIRDVNYAIRWLKHRAREFSIDPSQIVIGGHSSGAHLAALSAFANRSEFEPVEGPSTSSDVAAAVLLNGPYDIRKFGATEPSRVSVSKPIQGLIGADFSEAPSVYLRASPIEHLDGTEPPTAILTSTGDEEIPLYDSVVLRERLEETGCDVEFHVAEGGGHLAFLDGHSHYEEGIERIGRFLDASLDPATTSDE